ncbi:MAG: hypothetical protein IKP66_10065 [Lachnospiraceae bacterium]|nr:hypothetical protein [Lachnospiraceae bacterium]
MKNAIKILIALLVVIICFNIIINVKIRNIDIVGNNNVSDTEIVTSLFDSDVDRISLVFFIKSKFEKKKDILLVDSYDIKWITPFNIVVTVKENPPIAFIKRDIKNVYFDKNGVINEMTEERKPGIIEVIGVSFKNYEKGSKIEISNAKTLKAILNITSFLKEQHLSAELLEIRQEEEFYIYIDNIVVYMGNIDNM